MRSILRFKDGTFIVPAVQLSQVNSAFLRTNVAYATRNRQARS